MLRKISLLLIAIFGISFLVTACNQQDKKEDCEHCNKDEAATKDQTLKVGAKAPGFTLKNQNSEEVSLKDFLGKPVLVYFYPKDDTPGCTKEACTIKDNYQRFQDLDLVVLGISADSPESHMKFKQKYDLPFTLLSDPDKMAVKAYNADGVFIKRISYLIDKKGNIIKIYKSVDPASHASEIIADYQDLQKEPAGV
jgi:peroxiredoxin Q/BCP